MIFLIIVFALFVLFPEILEVLAVSVFSVGGWFLIVFLFMLSVVLCLSAMWPVFHWIAVFLGPKTVDQIITPLIGTMVVLGPFLGLFDAMTGWPLTKAAYYWTTKLFKSKTWTRRTPC